MAETRKPLLPVCPKVHEGSTEEQTVRAMAIEGLTRRMDDAGADEATRAKYRQRLDYELDVIASMGFSGYFLIVADFIQWSKQQGIPVGPGRGSGAGSVAAWALTITDLDPLQFNLLFERFLNPERVSMPDFDIDFCQEGRDRVIEYVRQEYGGDRVAQIITFGKLQARAAVRDVGRVLGLPYGQVNRVAELIPNNPAKPVTLKDALAGEPRLQALRDSDEGIARLLEIALQIEGLYRHASTHAAGVVIGDRPLVELVPLYKDPKSDFLVTQYSMKHVELAGLVKFDFLGLTTLTILSRAEGFLKKLGVSVDLQHLPLDDTKTYEMLSRGEAGGVFQMEGQGVRDTLRQMRPNRIEDLIADRRAVSSRSDGQHPRLLPPQARRGLGCAASRYSRHPGRDLWHHGLSGTGHADRADDGGLFARLGGSAAARDGQEDRLRNGSAARHLHQRRDRARHRAGEGQGSLRPDGEVRRLRLQQIACRGLCAGRLSDRVAEGQPPGSVHRRVHESRDQQHRPAGRAEAGGGVWRPDDPAARHQSFRRRFLGRADGGRAAGDPLRARRA